MKPLSGSVFYPSFKENRHVSIVSPAFIQLSVRERARTCVCVGGGARRENQVCARQECAPGSSLQKCNLSMRFEISLSAYELALAPFCHALRKSFMTGCLNKLWFLNLHFLSDICLPRINFWEALPSLRPVFPLPQRDLRAFKLKSAFSLLIPLGTWYRYRTSGAANWAQFCTETGDFRLPSRALQRGRVILKGRVHLACGNVLYLLPFAHFNASRL